MEGRARSVLFTPVGSFWDAFITSAVYFTGGNEEKGIHTLLASPAVWDSEIGHTVEWIGGASLGGHEAAAIDTELKSSQCVYCASFLCRAFPSFLSLPPLFSFPSLPPPLGFSLLCVPVAPASPTPRQSPFIPATVSIVYWEERDRNCCQFTWPQPGPKWVLDALVLSPILGRQEQWTASPRGCLGGQDFLISPGGWVSSMWGQKADFFDFYICSSFMLPVFHFKGE